jgi:hypothetical protein
MNMQDKIEVSKGYIRSRKSRKTWQYNGHKKYDKGSINDLQNTTQKAKDWPTRTH